MRWGPLLRSLHPDVVAVVDGLAPLLVDALGPDLAGLYLTGSLAMGGFAYATSDIDFVALVEADLGPHQLARLQERYTRMRQDGGYWARRVEGIHLPVRELAPGGARPRSYHELVLSGAVVRCTPTTQWLIQLHVARAYGICLVGPSPAVLIPAISADDLRSAVAHDDLMTIPLAAAAPVPERALAYQVLLACRVLFRHAHGRVGTKPGSARWAMRVLDPRWTPLIAWALTAQRSTRTVSCPQAAEFVAHVRSLLVDGARLGPWWARG